MSKKRRRQQKRKPSSGRASTGRARQTAKQPAAAPLRERLVLGAALAGVAALAVALFLAWNHFHSAENAAPPSETADADRIAADGKADDGLPNGQSESSGARHETPVDTDEPSSAAASKSSPSFLESFGSPESKTADGGGPKDTAALEQSFDEMRVAMDERYELQARIAAALKANDAAELTRLQSEGRSLSARLTARLSRFEGDLKAARASRPDDPLVQWLTGELLMHVGGEPGEILPYFERAAAGGLQRPRLVASLARAQFEANQFDVANRTALQALESDQPGQPDQYAWETYDRVARGNDQFDELLRRLDEAFPSPEKRPEWVTSMRERAEKMAELWHRELDLRQADSRQDDLPRVRLTVEHRRFARDAEGNSTSQIESSGRGEMVLELFEDQAPQTVANFISLVESGFYDGTLFMVAESARYLHGGDPNTKNDNPDDDGDGGPGYVTPDEFALPDARDHFCGSLSMVNTGPHTAGSQFFITLSPIEPFNRHFTVFGRVIEGEDVALAITPGRTTRRLGHFGKVIPGDVLVKAEVIRKRPHEYVATKE